MNQKSPRMIFVKMIVCKTCLFAGILFVAIALLCFMMPFIAVMTKSYEGGEQAWGAFLFYILLSLPATAFILVHNRLCLPHWIRIGRIILATLFGLPIIVGILAFLFSSIR